MKSFAIWLHEAPQPGLNLAPVKPLFIRRNRLRAKRLADRLNQTRPDPSLQKYTVRTVS